MCDLFVTVNPGISLFDCRRQWIPVGGKFSIGRNYHVKISLGGKNQALRMSEVIGGKRLNDFDVKEGHWLNIPVVGGNLQLLPKAIRYSDAGIAKALLIESVILPAKQYSIL